MLFKEMYKSFKIGLVSLPIVFFSQQAVALDCSSYEKYNIDESYVNGEIVVHANEVYQCRLGGWCSTHGAYALDTGWARKYTWTLLGRCDVASMSIATSTPLPPPPQPPIPIEPIRVK